MEAQFVAVADNGLLSMATIVQLCARHANPTRTYTRLRYSRLMIASCHEPRPVARRDPTDFRSIKPPPFNLFGQIFPSSMRIWDFL